jgi:transforming growth factor-beta-induced protein
MKNLKNYATRIFSSALLLGTVVAATFTACKKSNNDPVQPSQQNIVQVAQGNTNFSSLVTALTRADLVTTLSGTGPFTVFAPTNAAFTASGIDVNTIAVTSLKPVLLYHVSAGKALAANIAAGASKITSLKADESKTVYVSKNGSSVFLNGGGAPNGATVTQADIQASNGVIHAIDRVIQFPTQNIAQLASGNTNLSFLAAAVTRAGGNVAQTLSSASANGNTVFAPTNAAFQAAGFADVAAINAADPAVLTSILLYHVVPGYVFSTDLANGDVTTAGGAKVTIAVSGSTATVKGIGNTQPSAITAVNILATNGVVHVIDRVLLSAAPLKTIVETVVGSTDFDILEAAVLKAGLATALGANNLTVFAPNDVAFVAALRSVTGSTTLDEAGALAAINGLTATSTPLNIPQLTAILQYHVLSSKVLAADVPAGPNAAVPTLLGATGTPLPIYTTRSGSNVSVNGIQVTTANVLASNGVIHIVNRLIAPPLGPGQAGDIVGFLTSSFSANQYNLLVAAATKTDLVGALRGTGPLTLFAPTDDAFLATLRVLANAPTLTEQQGIDAINGLTPTSTSPISIADLKNILLYHVVSGRVYSTNLTAGDVPSLLNVTGSTTAFQTLTIALPTTGPTVKGSKNTTASNVFVASSLAYDITTTNGVIHTIDQVLLPN